MLSWNRYFRPIYIKGQSPLNNWQPVSLSRLRMASDRVSKYLIKESVLWESGIHQLTRNNGSVNWFLAGMFSSCDCDRRLAGRPRIYDLSLSRTQMSRERIPILFLLGLLLGAGICAQPHGCDPACYKYGEICFLKNGKKHRLLIDI